MLGFPPDATVPHPNARRRRSAPVFGTRGVSTGQVPLIASSGATVLANGGNAVDAAIAAAWTATVVMPESCGLGGDLFAIVHKPGTPLSTVLSSGLSPRDASIEFMREHGHDNGRLMPQYGPLSPAVPGFVAGIEELHRLYGTLPMQLLTRDAIGYANDGFAVTNHFVRAATLVADHLIENEVAASLFLKNGQPYAPGSLLRQQQLAKTIEQITRDGLDTFYTGSIAQQITNDLKAVGGKLNADDFAGIAPIVAPPISTTYRNHTVWETGFPTPGMVLLEALNIVEGADLGEIGIDSAAGVHVQVEALKLAFADRLANVADPAFVDPQIERIISKPLAADRYGRINPDQASASVKVAPLSAGDTTSMVLVDGHGMMVTIIISLSGAFGSCVVSGETGVVLNNRAGHCFSLVDGHPNIYAPGKKTTHTLNCYMIGDAEGNPLLVGGTPGGDSQPQWNLQTITGLIDAGLDVQAATEVSRWTIWPGTYPADVGNPYELRIEAQIGDATIEGLRRRGHALSVQEPWAQGGSVQVISRDPDTGVLAGGSDPRADGLAIAI